MAFEFKPFSLKQLDVICNANAFINILEGAVRSGKTIASQIAWVEFMRTSPHDRFLMSGKTVDTLYRNVIEDIIKIYGRSRVRYIKSSSGGAQLIFTFKVAGKKVKKIAYCVGAHDERAEERIRGMTVAGWYVDEITLHPESFVKQAINRMSLPKSRAIWTTNPDSPYHFIKTEFIDKAEEKGYKVWHFDLDDNLALDETYKENVKNAYSGLWYKRMILGLWVLAEGTIYDMFDEDVHAIDQAPENIERFYVGIDYGTKNPTAFVLVGQKNGCLYVLDEYYYNGREIGRQKTDMEYSVDFQRFVADITYPLIAIDPSAASFIAQLRKDRVSNIRKADNAVLDGIRHVSNLIAKKRLFVMRKCKNLLREFSSYVWDEKAAKKGEDKPLKDNDHALDALRYVIMMAKDSLNGVMGIRGAGRNATADINW
ncbi:PBSX family phage terminase large subunit [Aneurinibacillus sp. Ricciae_BoGa-3]|uniref:PBSX family phage terminase large subunit n=1 Tax=Aneurinibacillus sp. Ricciae_BoGa-3 TaxID=3022697 RepID=UPI00234245CD|nr:PBSX family phage terminase large subunit [Aneurinibacillus sp. Ricciae_BoGa-3]WCK55420.1 PBSX family phage terminase large subunit [Aneurinibacillus sp. Ricciae_BoGa-3]